MPHLLLCREAWNRRVKGFLGGGSAASARASRSLWTNSSRCSKLFKACRPQSCFRCCSWYRGIASAAAPAPDTEPAPEPAPLPAPSADASIIQGREAKLGGAAAFLPVLRKLAQKEEFPPPSASKRRNRPVKRLLNTPLVPTAPCLLLPLEFAARSCARTSNPLSPRRSRRFGYYLRQLRSYDGCVSEISRKCRLLSLLVSVCGVAFFGEVNRTFSSQPRV